jgi:citrate synthase
VKTATFEEVAGWLWHGTRERESFAAPKEMLDVARRVGKALRDQPVMDQVRAVVAAIHGTDPFRDDRRPEAVAEAGRKIIATIIETLPVLGDDPGPDASIAARLWPRLTAYAPKPRLLKLLESTLVLMADHELAASTLAARVAASTWADPYLVVLAGLATLGGPLHGAASREARKLLHEVHSGEASPAEAIASRLRDNQLIPGFGHRVYKDNDPRAEIMLEQLRAIRTVAVEEELLQIMHERGLPFPNVDFALACFAVRYDMIDNPGEVIFAVTRTVGWIAHAIEEYKHRLRFRSRAVYTGTPLSTS